ncbi:Aflatoxin biosynthesis regulatory protein [Penicillium robsamsonii]|uniref:Aflatoxin biosynthesis regulatory protein n=1 Tax=Penicillium robsamsonii TaxID=1792511 RepID=UPI0025479EC0|nr:Aflatoxin biosynthesis regulatory protein [Penicillium robsamsonii]KAJ5816544.1 Aflatoxin biosynthesis regulatory protein [Penicillium robsamsonii]
MSALDLGDQVLDRTTPPSPVMTPSRPSAGGTKLRDSCHACATSKIKCPKEKPACSKCEARGIKCQYFFAKRPGRRRENSTGGHPNGSTGKDNTNFHISSSNFKPSTRDGDTIEITECSPGAAAAPPIGLPETISFPDTPPNFTISISPMTDTPLGTFSSNLFSVIGDSGLFANLPDFDPDIDDMDFVIADPLNFERPLVDGETATRPPNDIGSLLMPDESVDFSLGTSEIDELASAFFTGSSGASSLTSSSVQTPSIARSSAVRATTATNSPCGCVAQALDLLKTLSSTHSKFAGTDLASSWSNVNDSGIVESVLSENKNHIETVTSMLSCISCIENAFLLAIISMIGLKILERYASEARIQSSGSRAGSVEPDTGLRSASSIISSSSMDHYIRALGRTYNKDSAANGRIPAQLVLSELHRVQRLVNQLSSKLIGPRGNGRGLGQECSDRHSGAEDNDRAVATFFSSSTLAQMESDLRKSLSSLSADIINRLRQN